MTPECEDCGESFETFTRLRLHDCPAPERADAETGNDGTIQELDDLVTRLGDGDFDALHRALATYSGSLERALEEQSDGGTYRDIFWEYYEPLANGLDAATRAEGWQFLEEFVDAYHPSTSEGVPLGSPAIENAVGRHVIRTRYVDGVESVPVDALEYLTSIVAHAEPEDDVELEAAHPYGWGIGHPGHSVADHLHGHVADDVFFVNPALEHAFYADQHAAVDLLERISRDDAIQRTLPYSTGDVSATRYLLDAPAGAASDEYWPNIPRYWEWREDIGYGFDLDEDVERRIRGLVRDTGLDDDLPAGWEIPDLIL